MSTFIKSIIGSSIILGKVYETCDYDQIHFILGNRKIENPHVQEIYSDMMARGWLITSLCLMVTMKDKLYVLCGQHRVKAAKLAGIPIKFIVIQKYEKDDQATRDAALEAIQKDSATNMGWNTAAYLHTHSTRGKQHYTNLITWMTLNSVDNIELSLILMGKDNSSRMLKDFRDGLFEMGNTTLAEERLARIRQISAMGLNGRKFTFVFNRNFVRAFCHVNDLQDYNHKEFLRVMALPKQNSMFCKQADVPSYKKLMMDIYNVGKARENKKFFV